MAVIKSGATTDVLTIDPTSKAARMTLYDSAGREISKQGKCTYAASGAFTPPATPTDMLVIVGSASKTVRVLSIKLGTNNTAAGSQIFVLVKRSTDDSGGTPVTATNIPLDSGNPAATAVVRHYTANPAGLGTLLGTICTVKRSSPVLTPASFAGIVEDAALEMLYWNTYPGVFQPVTLRAATEILAVNFAGAALVAGQIHYYTVVWTEE